MTWLRKFCHPVCCHAIMLIHTTIREMSICWQSYYFHLIQKFYKEIIKFNIHYFFATNYYCGFKTKKFKC